MHDTFWVVGVGDASSVLSHHGNERNFLDGNRLKKAAVVLRHLGN